ncbi:fimbrial assembly protein PilQ [Marinobacterium zhoushanense]|uniref:Fimbrial assembly protein PilQ n=1 Tax=Marinobacterium zhoushanense TaxID=1679163 RepID=A0ABQ1KLJ3_9GAMM|nr:type IV pilus secretin PilQ [Marinobacterium zhoushanense]GGB98407.1 fimbrial assembly protein PilQ [Marinobacterium zhoushanense]
MLTVNRLNEHAKGRLLSRAASWVKGVVFAALAVSFTSPVWAQDAQLKDSSFVALPGNKLEVRFDFDQPPPAPKAYMIDSPPRFVMDFWGVSNELGVRQMDVQSGQVDSLSFAQAEGRLRVVTNLNELAQYRTFTDGNSLFIEFSTTGSTVLAEAPIAPSKPVAGPRMPAMQDDRTRVQGIDFERIEGGQGRVVITMSDDEAGLDVFEEGNNVVLNLIGAGLSDNLEQRVDVQDFATPVMFIDSMVSGENTTILIKPSAEPYDYMAYQTGNQLFVDFKPLTAQEQADTSDLFPYSGEKIDLNFQDVSVRSILQIIAEVAEMNLVISDAVDSSAGNITLRLKNVPWDQALDIILKTKGLDKREVGNVLMIGTSSEIAAREKEELESQQQVQELAPLVTDYVQVDFRRASELKNYIETAKLISERGFVLADDQTNVLMIRETAAQIEEIRRTLRKFDVEVAQILIEARVVTASSNFEKNLGIRWAGFAVGSINGNETYITNAVNNNDMLVDLGVSATSGFEVGFISSNFAIAAELTALQSDGVVEIVSQPKVITTNGTEATIESGQEVPYQVVEEDKTTIEFKDALLSLKVTPQVNPGDRISLDLVINEDSLGQILENGERAINKNQVETSVVVNDGDTVVLGGVFRKETRNTVNKVPLLGDIPVVGNLFKSRQQSDSKEELLIFITPKLVRESLTVR